MSIEKEVAQGTPTIKQVLLPEKEKRSTDVLVCTPFHYALPCKA